MPFIPSAALLSTPELAQYRIMATDFGVVADGVTDDLAALSACLTAAYTGVGGWITIELPPGIIKVGDQFDFGTNVTWIGQGSRPGNQGGTELQYAGPDAQDWFICGAPGEDWSNSFLSGLRITQFGSTTYTSGYALHIYNPTNSSAISDLFVRSAPDGQIFIDDATGGAGNPGPNFFKISSTFVHGGIIPLKIKGGNQNTLVEFGGCDTDETSTAGVYVSGGVAEARPITFVSYKVEGDHDIPGYYVTGISPVGFIGCIRWANANDLTAPGFVYENPSQPNCQVMMLNCTTKGTTTAFHAPDLDVTVRGSAVGDGRYFTFIPTRHLLFGPFGLSSDQQLAVTLHNSCYLGWTDSSGSTQTLDTFVKRAAAGVVNLGKLAVGNSAAATIPGAVTKKVEVYDENGASLGYLAIYDGIA